MIFIPRSIESRGHHEKSPAVRNFILTAGLFWFLKASLHLRLQSYIFFQNSQIFLQLFAHLSHYLN